MQAHAEAELLVLLRLYHHSGCGALLELLGQSAFFCHDYPRECRRQTPKGIPFAPGNGSQPLQRDITNVVIASAI